MKRKTSAHYQREYRKRLREQGLVKKEVWILPEHARRLLEIEKELRHPAAAPLTGVRKMVSNELWTTVSLCDALKESELFVAGAASVELLEGAEPSLHITMHEYGDLPLFLTVAGEQILVEAVMWPASMVPDTAAFNEAVLRTHKLFPLSTISLDAMPDGDDYYQMFGALSASSILVNVVFEIEMLADNVIKATEAYGQYLDTGTAEAAG